MPARKPRPNETPQFERFIETARNVEADETDERLERIIRPLARPKSHGESSERRGAKPSKKSRT
jgi:hypothetical protein